MGLYVTRFTKAKKFPQHCGKKPPAWAVLPGRAWDRWRGKTVYLFEWESPNDTWTCGTNCVWRVSHESAHRIIGRLEDSRYFYVCEHQIQKKSIKKIL
jgi:hypothetical protein